MSIGGGSLAKELQPASARAAANIGKVCQKRPNISHPAASPEKHYETCANKGLRLPGDRHQRRGVVASRYTQDNAQTCLQTAGRNDMALCTGMSACINGTELLTQASLLAVGRLTRAL